jgi:hypothetical protein
MLLLAVLSLDTTITHTLKCDENRELVSTQITPSIANYDLLTKKRKRMKKIGSFP